MKIITDIKNTNIESNTAVAIGKFDGVHLGHRALLERLVEHKGAGLKTIVFTFNPSPAVFFGGADDKLLATDEEKIELLEAMGIDYLYEFPFNMSTAGMEPEAFISEILVNSLHASYIIAGTDMSYGKGGKGDIALLKQCANKYFYEAEEIEKISLDGVVISSSEIRSLISVGNMEKANAMLGQPYAIAGEVRYGNRLGRTIGFPTVNIIPDTNKLLPPNGVYISKIEFDGKVYNSISNIGTKPTVTEEKVMTLETHIYDFAGDLYGKKVKVSLLQFKRPEMRFASIEQLAKTVHKDMDDGRIYFSKLCQLNN